MEDAEFLEFVAKDVNVCRSRKILRGDVTVLRQNPVRWRAALDLVLAEALTRVDLAKQKEKEAGRPMHYLAAAESFLYHCHLRIMECDRVLYLATADPETSVARMLCDKIASHRVSKGGVGDSEDTVLWNALDGVAVRVP